MVYFPGTDGSKKKRLGSRKNLTTRTFIKTFLREQDFLDLATVNTGLVHRFAGLGYKKGPQK